MKRQEFDFIAALIKQRAGLVLSLDKAYLVERRLGSVAQRRKCSDLGQLIEIIRSEPGGEVARDVVDAVLTKDTYFFRGAEAFRSLRETVLPRIQIQRAEQHSLRIWSAACATGQEAYSAAMVLDQMAVALAGWSCEVLASDLNRAAIGRADDGLYNRFEVQRGLPVRMLLKYFKEAPDEQWQVADRIRAMVGFHEANLLEPHSGFGTFDVILCRHVLHAFDAETQAATLDRLAGAMNDGGILMLGAGEKVAGLTQRFLPFEGLDGIHVRPATAGRGQAAPGEAAPPAPGASRASA
jgi:chemotaxis protein methyltransferase CheR